MSDRPAYKVRGGGKAVRGETGTAISRRAFYCLLAFYSSAQLSKSTACCICPVFIAGMHALLNG